MRATIGAAIALGLFAAAAAPADATTYSAQQGAVQATLDYTGSAGSYTTQTLRIVRGGTTLFDGAPSLPECGDGPCGPSGYAPDPPLRVLDLDANGEPEVVYSAFTGGAHCCSVAQVYRLDAAGTGYTTLARNFGDPGFRIADLDGDGRPEWVTGDDRFAYLYTSYAFSGLPIQILHYASGGFADVTGSFPARVRKDDRHWWKQYLHLRSHTDGTELGVLAAWAADQYRLGRRAGTLRTLRGELRHGRLRGTGLHGARYVARLDRFLRRHGY